MGKNILRNLFKSEHCYEGFDWDYINTIPEMARLHQCEQNPMWHSEGNAFKHTQLACEKLHTDIYRNNIEEYFSLNDNEILLIYAAVVLHDIGKALDHDMEGTHIEIGVDVLKKYKEKDVILNAVEAHHEDVEPQTLEAVKHILLEKFPLIIVNSYCLPRSCIYAECIFSFVPYLLIALITEESTSNSSSL